MREIRLSGLEGGVRHNPHPYPYRQTGCLRYGLRYGRVGKGRH